MNPEEAKDHAIFVTIWKYKKRKPSSQQKQDHKSEVELEEDNESLMKKNKEPKEKKNKLKPDRKELTGKIKLKENKDK